MADPLKILNIVGARPNLLKIAPLMPEMRKHASIQPVLVHTGQHYDEKLSDGLFTGRREAGHIRRAVEAGPRSFDKTMPKEIIRILTDAPADHVFVTEVDAIGNLLKEGRPRNRIYLVGNVMIEALRHFLPPAR